METPFINIEYIFFKIYDFLGSVFGAGSGNNGFGPIGNRSFLEWVQDFFFGTFSVVWVVLIIAFLGFFMLAIYIRLDIRSLDKKNEKKFDDHFIKPQPKIKDNQKKNPRWEHVEKLFASSNQNDWRVAIIEADTMLDELLQSYNFPGVNLGERLKNANTRVLPTVQSAWEAHKVRNKIAHEGVNFKLSEREAQLTKKHFEFVFKDAGVI